MAVPYKTGREIPTRSDEIYPFVHGFLVGRGVFAGVKGTWFPTGMRLHIVPDGESQIPGCVQALDALLGLLSGWTGEVMPVGWRREVQ